MAPSTASVACTALVLAALAVFTDAGGHGGHERIHFKIYVPKYIKKHHHTKTVFIHVGGEGHPGWTEGHEEGGPDENHISHDFGHSWTHKYNFGSQQDWHHSSGEDHKETFSEGLHSHEFDHSGGSDAKHGASLSLGHEALAALMQAGAGGHGGEGHVMAGHQQHHGDAGHGALLMAQGVTGSSHVQQDDAMNAMVSYGPGAGAGAGTGGFGGFGGGAGGGHGYSVHENPEGMAGGHGIMTAVDFGHVASEGYYQGGGDSYGQKYAHSSYY